MVKSTSKLAEESGCEVESRASYINIWRQSASRAPLEQQREKIKMLKMKEKKGR